MKLFRNAACLAVLLTVVALGVTADSASSGFDQAVALETVTEPTANVSVGDVNGDGYPDIVLAKGRHWPVASMVLLNDGKGHFENRHPVSERASRSYTAALADLNGDGTLDLVVGNDSPDEKIIYFNDGKGNFSFAGTFGEPGWPTRNVTVVDLNGDHRPDIVVANRSGDAGLANDPSNPNANYICLNDGHGHFPSCTVLSKESATTIAAGDLNGDGAVDLVVPNRDYGQSYVFFNDGKGGFKRKAPFGPAHSATRAVALGDIDGDGRLDIIVGDEIRGGALIYFNRGGKFSDPLPIGEKTDTPYSIAVADLDGDGCPDIVLGNEATPSAILLNDGTGAHFKLIRFGDKRGAVYGLAIADLNGDGTPDIVAARSDAPSMLYLNTLPRKVKSKSSARR